MPRGIPPARLLGEGNGNTACDLTCPDDEMENLDQLAGVTASSSDNMDDRGNPRSVIDMSHAPDEWTASPTADYDTCAEQAYMTIDLGSVHSTTGATIWHYYGNDRAHCSQKVALSATGVFRGERL